MVLRQQAMPLRITHHLEAFSEESFSIHEALKGNVALLGLETGITNFQSFRPAENQVFVRLNNVKHRMADDQVRERTGRHCG